MEFCTWNQLIGERLRKLRVGGNYSQAFVAECLGLSRNAYLHRESGKIDFYLEPFGKYFLLLRNKPI